MAGGQKISKVGVTGVTVALAGLVLGDFVLVRRNRLTPGLPLSVFEALAELQWALLLAGLAILLLFSIWPGRRQAAAGMLLIVLLVLTLLGFAGSAASGRRSSPVWLRTTGSSSSRDRSWRRFLPSLPMRRSILSKTGWDRLRRWREGEENEQ